MTGMPARAPWANTSRGLFLVALAVFLLTVGIGVLNGLDAVEFSRDLLLTHVHSGTLGWITLGVAATACWVYGGMDRLLGWPFGVERNTAHRGPPGTPSLASGTQVSCEQRHDPAMSERPTALDTGARQESVVEARARPTRWTLPR